MRILGIKKRPWFSDTLVLRLDISYWGTPAALHLGTSEEEMLKTLPLLDTLLDATGEQTEEILNNPQWSRMSRVWPWFENPEEEPIESAEDSEPRGLLESYDLSWFDTAGVEYEIALEVEDDKSL